MWEFRKFKKQEFVPLIKFIVDMYKPDSYLEIGIQRGYTFNQIAPFVKEAVGVDPNPLFENQNKNAEIFIGTSEEYYKSIDEKYFDLILIDGDHEYKSVLKDVDMFLEHLTPFTGLMLLHDTYPGSSVVAEKGYCHNAWMAARKIHKEYKDVEIVTLPGPYAGLSILRYAPRHLHWQK